jgi:hypothetical protein
MRGMPARDAAGSPDSAASGDAARRDASGDSDAGPVPCARVPEPLVRLSGRWSALAVDAEAIYLGSDAVYRMAKAEGSELERFAESAGQVTALVSQDRRLVWFAQSSTVTSLLFASKADAVTHAVQLDADTGRTLARTRRFALAAATSFVYGAFEGAEQRHFVVRLAPDTDRATAFAQILGPAPLELAADDEAAYVSLGGVLMAWDERGRRAVAATLVTHVIADEQFLYGLSGAALDRDGGPGGRVLVRLPKNTLAEEALGGLTAEGDVLLASHETSAHLYWTGPTGALGRASKTGGEVELIATTGAYDDDDYDTLIAVDEASVYWIGGEEGTRASDDAPVWLYRTCR